MLRKISFTIHEKPMILKRHRHTKDGKTYDPQKKDKLYYGILIQRAIEQHHSLKEHLLCGPIFIDLKFFFPLPNTKRLRDKKGLYNTDKKDLDNAIKAILDVCSGILYADDAYVFSIQAAKYNTTNKARTEVTIKEVLQEQILENNHGHKASQMSPQNIIPARTPNY